MPTLGRATTPTYTVLERLSEGATADTDKVLNEVTGQVCVRKTYSTIGLEDAAAVREPRLLAEIAHPHIAEVYEARFGDDPETITFVAPFYEGGSVLTNLSDGYRFSMHQALRLGAHAYGALAHLHERHGLIHRDVKPSNLFLEGDRLTGRLGDFGSAAPIGQDGCASPVNGTILYRPPEAGPDQGRHGAAGDIYAAGLSLFEMLTGPLPYAAIDRDEVEKRLVRGLPALPASKFEFAPQIPPRVRTIVRKAMRTDPGERFESARAAIAAINRLTVIDWRHVDGEGLLGRWEGSWPPHKPLERRRFYHVTSRELRAGADSGRLRLSATQAARFGSDFSRFGVADETLDSDDSRGVGDFFEKVAEKAAHLEPVLR